MWETFSECIVNQNIQNENELKELRKILIKVTKKDMEEKECASPVYRDLEEKECESTVFTKMKTEETEETGKTKRWRAKMGETYFYVGSDAVVYSAKELYGNRNDRYWDLGNYFRTSEEALRYSVEFVIMFQERTLEKKGLRWNPETEEIEEAKEQRWRAKRGESYCYVRIPLDEIFLNEENFDETDNYLWESGNYFRTIDEAKKYADKFRRMLKERTLDKEV